MCGPGRIGTWALAGRELAGFVMSMICELTDPAAYAAAFPNCNPANADVNADGSINNFDIDAFVELLIAP